MTADKLRALVRDVPDFPKAGILFHDVTTLIGHGEGFAVAVRQLADLAEAAGADAVAGIEARGFIFGSAVAVALGKGFVPIRKPGKLPVPTLSIDNALEYGSDSLEIDPGAVAGGQRVVIVDDLIATGGTASAGAELLRRAGAVVEHALFVVDLPDLGGAERLRREGLAVSALIDFPGR